MMKKYLPLLVWISALQLIGSALGMITGAGTDPWYLALHKSSLTPPGYVFGIVWSLLYLILAIVGWQLSLPSRVKDVGRLRFWFWAQLILNWMWTPLFFYLHWVSAALACLIFIVMLTAGFLFASFKRNKALFCLMLPYWFWLCFALYLNFIIWFGR